MPKSSTKAELDFLKLFAGKKSHWIPLCRRFLARLTRVPGVEASIQKTFIQLSVPSKPSSLLGKVRVTSKGLEVGLTLAKFKVKSERLKAAPKSAKPITHRVLLTDASEIDEEFIAWVRGTHLQAHTSK